MIKKIKNNTGSDKIIKGQVVAPGDFYIIPEGEYSKFGDTTLNAEIASGDLVINDGTNDLSATDGQKILLQSYNIGTKLLDDVNIQHASRLAYNQETGKIEYRNYTEKATNLGTSGSGTWVSRTITGGSGKIAEILFYNSYNGDYIAGCRTVGSNIDRKFTIGKGASLVLRVLVDSNENIQTYTNSTGVSITLIGWE